MKVLNLAASALLSSLERNHIDQNLLIVGTDVKMEKLLKLKKLHSWEDFIKMYENCGKLLGPEIAVSEIGHLGLYNEGISYIRKMAYSLIDIKTAYWATCTFVAKHLFKECVTFKYTKIKSNQILIVIDIHPDLEDCPLLLETYTHLFKEMPTVLGLSRARVTAKISARKGEYCIQLVHSSFFKYLFSRFFKSREGFKSSMDLMIELETQSIELTRLIDEKSALLRILSHDIANQANIIDFYLKKALAKSELGEVDRPYLENASKSSKRLCSILKNVQSMEISSVKEITLEPVDLDLIFHAIVNQYSVQLGKKKISVTCNNLIPANIMPLAEKSTLELNVLGNLISNAIKFSPENSVITLEAQFLQNKIFISVIDLGVGLSPQQRRNIFTKDIRISSLGTNGEKGTGFGLGIVNNYVKSYGGKVSVRENFPHGSIFTIELSAHVPQYFDGLSQYSIKTSESTIRN